MKVFKFGGASVRDASGIRNLHDIVASENDRLVVVVSALGKTTNALEQLHQSWRSNDSTMLSKCKAIADYHLEIASGLLGDNSVEVRSLGELFSSFSTDLTGRMKGDFDHDYDMIVSMGEIWSTVIVEAYLQRMGLRTKWQDIRKIFVTDDRYRDAGILWDETSALVAETFKFHDADIYVTQGFIGATSSGEATTLGREGSD
nr:aspartate kinase [Bacteroidales bacterium]